MWQRGVWQKGVETGACFGMRMAWPNDQTRFFRPLVFRATPGIWAERDAGSLSVAESSPARMRGFSISPGLRSPGYDTPVNIQEFTLDIEHLFSLS